MGNFVPTGSYSKTTKDTTSRLFCQSQKRDQSFQWSTLDITNLPAGKTISNIDGVLTIDA